MDRASTDSVIAKSEKDGSSKTNTNAGKPYKEDRAKEGTTCPSEFGASCGGN